MADLPPTRSYPTPLAAPLVGAEIGDLRLRELLGAGGMGRVFRAWDVRLERPVAVKFLADHLALQKEFRERFTREARALAALNHPNVAQIFALGEYQGLPYIVLELVEGGSLAVELATGRAPALSRLLGWWRQAAAGLAAALEARVIHRDIKPSNLLLDRSDRVKLVDFGLARRIGLDPSLTRSDATLGTPFYMAPEVATGGEVDHRADLYSLGATVYHLLAGRPPYDGATPYAIAMAHAQEPLVPLRERAPRVPARFAAIVERSLAKDPRDRYPTYGALLAALDDADRVAATTAPAAQPTTPLPVARRPARRDPGDRPIWFALALGAAMIGGATLYVWGPWSRPAAPNERAPTESRESAAPSAGEVAAALVPELTAPLASGAQGALETAAKRAQTMARMRRVAVLVAVSGAEGRETPSDPAELVRRYGEAADSATDAWGTPLTLEIEEDGAARVVSAGPDRQPGTGDDLRIDAPGGMPPADQAPGEEELVDPGAEPAPD